MPLALWWPYLICLHTLWCLTKKKQSFNAFQKWMKTTCLKISVITGLIWERSSLYELCQLQTVVIQCLFYWKESIVTPATGAKLSFERPKTRFECCTLQICGAGIKIVVLWKNSLLSSCKLPLLEYTEKIKALTFCLDTLIQPHQSPPGEIQASHLFKVVVRTVIYFS